MTRVDFTSPKAVVVSVMAERIVTLTGCSAAFVPDNVIPHGLDREAVAWTAATKSTAPILTCTAERRVSCVSRMIVGAAVPNSPNPAAPPHCRTSAGTTTVTISMMYNNSRRTVENSVWRFMWRVTSNGRDWLLRTLPTMIGRNVAWQRGAMSRRNGSRPLQEHRWRQAYGAYGREVC